MATVEKSIMICDTVLELEIAVGFVTDECQLLKPVEVSYVMVDGEGFIKIELSEQKADE